MLQFIANILEEILDIILSIFFTEKIQGRKTTSTTAHRERCL
jgi:hypothetical protein